MPVQITVQTADKRGAGTDADISIILKGAKGESGEMRLEGSRNDFERNKTDVFMLKLGQKDLGSIDAVNIGFSAKQSTAGVLGAAAGMSWGLQFLEVTHLNSGSSFFFSYGTLSQ